MVLNSTKQPIILGGIQTLQGKETCFPRGQPEETREMLLHTSHPIEKSHTPRLSLHTHIPSKAPGVPPHCLLWSLQNLAALCVFCGDCEQWPGHQIMKWLQHCCNESVLQCIHQTCSSGLSSAVSPSEESPQRPWQNPAFPVLTQHIHAIMHIPPGHCQGSVPSTRPGT